MSFLRFIEASKVAVALKRKTIQTDTVLPGSCRRQTAGFPLSGERSYDNQDVERYLTVDRLHFAYRPRRTNAATAKGTCQHCGPAAMPSYDAFDQSQTEANSASVRTVVQPPERLEDTRAIGF